MATISTPHNKIVSAAFLMSVALGGCAVEAPADDAAVGSDESNLSSSPFVCTDQLESASEGHGDFGTVVKTRAAGHPGFDRYVIEFGNNLMAHWLIQRTPTATFSIDPSDQKLTLPGTAGILATVRASMFPAMGEDPVFQGSPRFVPNGTAAITETANVGDFEGISSWALGLKKTSCYRVLELQNPARLVIDVQTN